MTFDNILFDLDGTLTDPYEGISKSVQYALKSFGIIENDIHILKSFIGPPLAESFSKIYGFDEEKAKQAVLKYRERYFEKGVHENKLTEGVEATLKLLLQNGKKLYLATSKPIELARIIISEFELDDYFTFLGGADLNFGRDAKHQVIEYVFEHIENLDKTRTVIVGDRMHDVIGAKKTGISSIGVLCGYGSREELQNYGADYIAESFPDILKFIL